MTGSCTTTYCRTNANQNGRKTGWKTRRGKTKYIRKN